MDNSIFAKLAAIPILILFLGAGLLAGRIAIDWTPENTQYVLGGSLTICGAGVGVFAAVFALVVGMALSRRLQADTHQEQPGWREVPRLPGYPPYPGLLPPPAWPEDEKAGYWLSNGQASYDVWEEQQPREWRIQE